jgi:predicted nucleic acid-binding protein
MILKVGEAGAILPLTCSEVIRELESAFKRKAPEALGDLALLLDRSGLDITPSPVKSRVDQCLKLIDHIGDAKILASAWSAEVDYFVTLDRKHFIQNERLLKETPFLIGTPGDFLEWFRQQLI